MKGNLYNLTAEVRVWGPGGMSDWSVPVPFQLPQNPPTAPTGISANWFDLDPQISWTGKPNSVWYRVLITPQGQPDVKVYRKWFQAGNSAHCWGALNADYSCYVSSLGLDGLLSVGSAYTVEVKAWGTGGMGAPGYGGFIYNPQP